MSPVIFPDTTQAAELSNIERGTYPARVEAVLATTSKKAGTPMLDITFRINVGGSERTRHAYVVTQGPGSFNFDQLLRAVKMDEVADKLKAGEKVGFDTDALVGQTLQVVVDAEMFEGNERDRIKAFLRA